MTHDPLLHDPALRAKATEYFRTINEILSLPMVHHDPAARNTVRKALSQRRLDLENEILDALRKKSE